MASLIEPNQPSAARDSRESLIAATTQIMTARNSIEFSLSEVASKSGLNAALVKYYFGSKRGLLIAVVEQIATRVLKQLHELIAMNISPVEKVRLHIAGVMKTYVRHPYCNRLIHSLQDSADPEVARLFVSPLIEAQKILLLEGERAGLFRQSNPIFFYVSVIGACDHLFYSSATLRMACGIDAITHELREEYTNYVCDMALSTLLIPQTGKCSTDDSHY